MALIKCSECGKEISDKADTCNGCGAPIKKLKIKVKNKFIHWLPLITSILVFMIIIFIYVVFDLVDHTTYSDSDDFYTVLNYILMIIDVIALIVVFYIIPKQRKILFPLSIIACIFTFLTIIGTGFGGW